jgi:hypothetical protein
MKKSRPASRLCLKYSCPTLWYICPVHLFVISSSAKCLRVSKTESYGVSRICFEMTRQATMPSSSEKCLCVSKTESYGLSKICFEMTRQATMPLVEGGLCLADEQHNSQITVACFIDVEGFDIKYRLVCFLCK